MRAGRWLLRRTYSSGALPVLPSRVAAALDERADANRVLLAKMLQLLRKRVVDSDPSVSQLAYPPEPESSSITLDAASLTRGTVSDVVQRLCTDPDARLHPTALKLALDSAASAAGQDRTVVDLTDRTMVSIVGDLHGCALSLRHVMGIVGAPSESSAIVFNGDFVDRGANGVEVLASLALLKACHPRDVVLLRGNHEDELLATAYGFKDELTSKYPGQAAELWDAAVRLFAALPLGATAPEAFIVHGGLPSEKFEIATLARLGVAERRLPSVLRAAAAPEGPSAHAAAEQLALMQGVLWSDPAHGRDHVGVKSNDSRGGTGCLFAEDVSRAFLQREGLRFLIRSHQVVEEGYERTVLDEPTTTKPSSELTKSLELLTVFSAAAYPNGEGANKGAVLRLRAAPVHGAVSGAGARAATLEPVTFQLHGASRQDRDADARRSLGALIRSHRGRLRERFGAHVREKQTRIGVDAWASVMRSELKLQVDWEALQPALAPTIKRGGSTGLVDTGLVDFERFLASPLVAGEAEGPRGKPASGGAAQAGEIERLYKSLESLRAVVEMLDTDKNGKVDRDEFLEGFQQLNEGLPDAEKLSSEQGWRDVANALFDTVDTDGSGTISLAELTEAFRMTVMR